MKNQDYHYRLLQLLFAALCLALPVKAQTYLGTGNNLSGVQPAGEYYDNTSITLSPGFSFTATSGSSLHLYITGPDCVPLATTPSINQNYISTLTLRSAGHTDNSFLTGLGTCDAMQTIQYLDGLGRPSQTVQVKGNALATADLVQAFDYDAFGREATKYLPYTTTTGTAGSYHTDAITIGSGVFAFYNGTSGAQQANGVVSTPHPYAQTVFEPSPLNRVVEQGAPGDAWQPGLHTVGTGYLTNDNSPINVAAGTGFPARLYRVTIDANNLRSLVDGGGNYNANELTVTVTHDENYTGTSKTGTVEEYKDLEGHIVLKRTFNHNATTGIDETLSTYYVYDDLGNLAFVLPPLANPDAGLSSAANATTLNNLCYQYNYDERNRLFRKRVPGKDWEYMVYNKLDQLVLSQDGRQRLLNQWTVSKYDAQGRVIMTGLWNAGSAITQATLQSSIYAAAQWDARDYTNATTGYAVSSYPATLSSILTVNYFDDYNNIPGMPAAYDQHTTYSSMTAGLTTATSTAILLTDGSVSSSRLLNVLYYDDKGRTVKTFSQHYLGGVISNNNYDEVATTYNFDNSSASTTLQHHTNAAAGAVTLTVANNFNYDHLGRKTETDEQINGGSWVAVNNLVFNEIGQLYQKHLHSAAGGVYLQNISYAYNERGWLSQVNDPTVAPSATSLFSMKLGYNSPVSAGSVAQYNGNIAEQIYNKGTVGSEFVTYKYDNLNRMIAGNSAEAFSENSINYDLMGNILAMQRFGPNAGVLTYAYYSGTNQLSGVSSSNSSVIRSYSAYDANGNAPSDGQGHAIAYNLLNLPMSIASLNLSYTYDATGRKLRKVNTSGSGSVTEYIDGIQYSGTSIDFIQTEEGRVLNPITSPNYEYTLTDHLGNNRITFDQVNGKTSEDDYYPFGLNVPRGTIPSDRNHYLYNKKELQDELGQYDYGARFYDPVIARWVVVDPKAELDRRWSPYEYGFNDPIRFIDPDGMWPDWGELVKGTITTVGGVLGVATGVVGGTASSVTVIGAAGGAALAAASAGAVVLGGSQIADSFRSKGNAMDIPSSVVVATAKAVSKKMGDKTGKTGEKVGEVLDLVSGGAPKSLLEKGVTVVNGVSTAGDLMGDHSSNVKKSGMQRDHTAASTTAPKPVVRQKNNQNSKPQTTIQAAN